MPTEHRSHPRGAAGIQASLDAVRQYVIKSLEGAEVKSHAHSVLRAAGFPQKPSEQAQALLAAQRSRVGYIPDGIDTEFMSTAKSSLCLDGAEVCMWGGDCDDLTIAFLSQCMAIGIDCAMVHQRFSDSDHVIGAVQTESGWQRVDPSYFDTVGDYHKTSKLQRERWIDVMSGYTLYEGPPNTPTGDVPDHVYLAARPEGNFVGVSGVVRGMLAGSSFVRPAKTENEKVLASWGTWLQAVDASMLESQQGARAALDGLKKTRAGLGMPEFDAEWTADLESGLQKVFEAIDLSHRYAQEALAGKRGAVWYVDPKGAGQLALEQLPGDTQAVVPINNGQGIQLSTLQPIRPEAAASGKPYGLGNLLVIAAIVGTVVVVGEGYLIMRQITEVYKAHMAQKTQRDLSATTDKLLKAGATPAEVGNITHNMATASQAVASTAAATTGQSDLVRFGKDILVGAMVVGLVGGGIWIASRLLPPRRAAA